MPKKGSKLSRSTKGLSKKEAELLFQEPSRTKRPKDGRFEAPAGRLPQGYRYVWNRLDREFEKWYDHKVEIWEPFEFKVFPEDVALWLHGHSILTEDSTGKSAERALAIDTEEGWLVPLVKFDPIEYIDRSTNDNPEGWGAGGLKTKAEVLGVRGANPKNFPDHARNVEDQ